MSKKDIFRSIVDRSITQIAITTTTKHIGKNAFAYCSSLTNVVIPDSVTSIEEMAFYNCGQLTDITIGSSVATIGYSAFIQTSPTSRTIIFRQPSGMEITLPSAGSSSGLFYNKTSYAITIYTDNEIIKNYDYSADNVTPTFYHLDGSAWE